MKKKMHRSRLFKHFPALVFSVAIGIVGSTLLLSSFAATSSLFVSPASGSYNQAANFSVTVRVNTNGDPVNAVQANLSYAADKLQLTSINESGSAFDIKAEQTNPATANGSIRLGRGTITAKTGSNLLVVTLNFKAKSPGSATVSFASGSSVVRSTDNANVLSGTSGGTYTIKAVSSPPPTPPPASPPPASPTPSPPPAATPGSPPASSPGSSPSPSSSAAAPAEDDPDSQLPSDESSDFITEDNDPALTTTGQGEDPPGIDGGANPEAFGRKLFKPAALAGIGLVFTSLGGVAFVLRRGIRHYHSLPRVAADGSGLTSDPLSDPLSNPYSSTDFDLSPHDVYPDSPPSPATQSVPPEPSPPTSIPVQHVAETPVQAQEEPIGQPEVQPPTPEVHQPDDPPPFQTPPKPL